MRGYVSLEEFCNWYRLLNESEVLDMHEVYLIYFNQEIYLEEYEKF
jgi:hypothetical protein